MRRRDLDSRLVADMKEQLRRLQERRKELETDDETLKEPILPHVTQIMRDRHLAQVRSMVQRNMDAIDRDIQEAIQRLGKVVLEETEEPKRNVPDLIPQRPVKSPLPSAGSPSRLELLQTVRETLERRRKDDVPAKVSSPRVGLFNFRHDEPDTEGKLGRLTVQKLPSVTIEAPQRPERLRNQIISVQSPSVEPPLMKPELDIDAEDVVRAMCDILGAEMDLAVDALRHDVRDDQFRPLAIDSSTQTAIRNVRDFSMMAEERRPALLNRAVGPDSPEPVSVTFEEEEEEDEPVTPPRSFANRAPDATPPDLNLWRRRYPPTPPSEPIACPEFVMKSDEGHSTSSVSTTAAAGSSNSSDATGISTSTLGSTGDAGASWMSEGEVLNRVASPGLVKVHPAMILRRSNMDRSCELTLSEGQVLDRFEPMSTDGISEGEVLLAGALDGQLHHPAPPRSDSTASFQSAAGSVGEVPADCYTTADDLESE